MTTPTRGMRCEDPYCNCTRPPWHCTPRVNTHTHRTVDTIIIAIAFAIAVALLRGLFWLLIGI